MICLVQCSYLGFDTHLREQIVVNGYTTITKSIWRKNRFWSKQRVRQFSHYNKYMVVKKKKNTKQFSTFLVSNHRYICIWLLGKDLCYIKIEICNKNGYRHTWYRQTDLLITTSYITPCWNDSSVVFPITRWQALNFRFLDRFYDTLSHQNMVD